MVERLIQQLARSGTSVDLPGQQVPEVIGARTEQRRSLQDSRIPGCMDLEQATPFCLDLRTSLIAIVARSRH